VGSAGLYERDRNLIQHWGDLFVGEHSGQGRPSDKGRLPGGTGKPSEDGITPIRQATRKTERKKDQFLSWSKTFLLDIYGQEA
jgi:hypothetical protein